MICLVHFARPTSPLMASTLYRQDIIERYRFPQYRGEIKTPDLQAEVVNSFCGDEVALYLKLAGDKQSVEAARFSGEGCALMTASADMLCSIVERKPLAEIKNFTAGDLLQRYGQSPSPARLKCVLLPYEALRRCRALFE